MLKLQHNLMMRIKGTHRHLPLPRPRIALKFVDSRWRGAAAGPLWWQLKPPCFQLRCCTQSSAAMEWKREEEREKELQLMKVPEWIFLLGEISRDSHDECMPAHLALRMMYVGAHLRRRNKFLFE